MQDPCCLHIEEEIPQRDRNTSAEHQAEGIHRFHCSNIQTCCQTFRRGTKRKATQNLDHHPETRCIFGGPRKWEDRNQHHSWSKWGSRTGAGVKRKRKKAALTVGWEPHVPL